MKRLLKVSLLIISVTLFFASCSDDDDDDLEDFVIEYSNLPTIAKDFLVHFGGESKITLVKERYVPESDGTYYTAYAVGGYEIDFNKSGQWIDIDGGNKELPASLFDTEIPAAIKTYVEANHQNQLIVEVKKITEGFEVELSNDKDLIFNSEGEFIR